MPRGTGTPHKGHDTNDRGVNKEDAEDGVEQRMALLVQHDDKDEDSIHAIVIANVHETKPDKENEKSLEVGQTQMKPDEGDDEAAGESGRRKPKTNTKSTTETRRKNRTRVVESVLTKLRIRCNICIV